MNSDKSITSVDGHKLDIYIAEAKKDSTLFNVCDKIKDFVIY